MNLSTELAVIALLVVANGLFAGAEIAMLAVRKTTLNERAQKGSGAARVALAMRANPERFLATVQVGITVIGATAAAFGGASLARRVAAVLERGGVSAEHADEAALAIVIVFVSYLSLVIGELVPKSLALRYAERYTLVAARPLQLISFIARPLVWFLTASSNVILRFFGDSTSFSEARLSPEELQQLLEEATTAGTLDARAGEYASRAFDLAGLKIGAVQVPRAEVVAVRRERLREDLTDALARTPHHRYPVIDQDLDSAVGYVVVRDVAATLIRGGDVAPLLRPIAFIPETRDAIDLLQEMQRTGQQLALVVDEQGGVTGLVTLEDLLEELVGEILGEGEQRRTLVVPDGEGAVVQGRTPVHELNRALDLELPESAEWTTVGGLVVARAGRIPSVGEAIVIDGTILEVLESTARRVVRVRIRKSA